MTPRLNLRELLNAHTRLLEESGIDSPRLSAEVLLAKALGLDRNELLKRLIITPNSPVGDSERLFADQLVARRAGGEPTAYILGVKEFYGHDFSVSPATLVPRPETELLVDLALGEIMRRRPAGQGGRGLFADFGTGSGCIAVTLSLTCPLWSGIAMDISKEALITAQGNAHRLNARNLAFVLADFTAPPLAPGSLELLVSNPPYISEDEYAGLNREVRDFEPKSALVPSLPNSGGTAVEPPQTARGAEQRNGVVASGQPNCGFFSPAGASGLEHSLAIIEQAALLLKPGGLLLMETSAARALPLLAALCGNDWSEGGIHKDFAELDRVLSARKRFL